MSERMLLRLATAALGLALLAPGGAQAKVDANVSGSIYVDQGIFSNRAAAANTVGTTTPDGSLKVTVDVHEEITFSAKVCFGCHGLEMDHLSVEYTPKSWFNVSAGRVVVPFGEYSNRYDPSSHKTADAPLIFDMGRMPYWQQNGWNEGVIPVPYVDTGVVLYGQTWISDILQIWYGAYGVAGLKGSNDVNYISMRSPYYADNNRVPAGGGRLALTLAQRDASSFLGDVSVGGSFTAGRYDPAATLNYTVWGVDAQARLGPVSLRGEYAARRTDLDPNANGYPYLPIDYFFDKKGFYVEADSPVPGVTQYLGAVVRYDRLNRDGLPTPGAAAFVTPSASIDRVTGGLMFTPVSAFYMKATYEYWSMSNVANFSALHLGVGGAF